MSLARFSVKQINEIQQEVAKACKISVEQLVSPRRNRKLVYARNLAFWLCREFVGVPFVETGKHFGGRNHSTVMKGIDHCKEICSDESRYYYRLKKRLTEHFEAKYQG